MAPGGGLLIALAGFVLLFGAATMFGAPYVPSQKKYVKRALKYLYKLGPDDLLVDIGSGDGLVLRAASERKARSVGYEINPVLVLISRLLIGPLHAKRTKVIWGNFWRATLPEETTVIYAFSVSRDARRLARKVQAEADRLGRPLSLLCFGPALKDRAPDKTFEAYSLYVFHPRVDGALQAAPAKV